LLEWNEVFWYYNKMIVIYEIWNGKKFIITDENAFRVDYNFTSGFLMIKAIERQIYDYLINERKIKEENFYLNFRFFGDDSLIDNFTKSFGVIFSFFEKKTKFKEIFEFTIPLKNGEIIKYEKLNVIIFDEKYYNYTNVILGILGSLSFFNSTRFKMGIK